METLVSLLFADRQYIGPLVKQIKRIIVFNVARGRNKLFIVAVKRSWSSSKLPETDNYSTAPETRYPLFYSM